MGTDDGVHREIQHKIAHLDDEWNEDVPDWPDGIPKGRLLIEMCEDGVPPPQTESALSELVDDGRVYKPVAGHFRNV